MTFRAIVPLFLFGKISGSIVPKKSQPDARKEGLKSNVPSAACQIPKTSISAPHRNIMKNLPRIINYIYKTGILIIYVFMVEELVPKVPL